jgi:FlaA1/EpsC-like NDP-sugar epimerase
MKSRTLQIIIIIVVDCAVVAFSEAAPLLLRFGIFTVNDVYLQRMLTCLPIDMAIAICVLAFFKLYNRVWSFAGYSELIAVLKASLVMEAIFVVYRMVFTDPMPRSYYLFEWVFLFLLLGGSRLFVRFYRQILKRNRAGTGLKNAMIVGAGSAASILINELRYKTMGTYVACIVDDNVQKKGKYISGIRIEGNRYDIPALAEKNNIDEIIIAIPSASPAEMHEIIQICGKTSARLKILPTYVKGMAVSSFSQAVRDVNYEDLLSRNTVEIGNEGLAKFLSGKTVLVTGAGGSIGSELCRQIAANGPGRLLMIDINENGIHDLTAELQRHYPAAEIITLVASVRDERRIAKIFETYHPQIIYHAAAHKHVPLMEDSPCEAVKNNCAGTLSLAQLADRYHAEHFIMISTDKAVRPTNVMGATKRICEMIVHMIGKTSDTRFVAVRFGNVLGSNGSVIPLFLRQIEEGGPVTVTHKDVTRFFMTISEAVSLVLQAGIPNGGGELFILDMGEPVKIYDLAVNLIKLKGLVPDKDIRIKFTGLRPGEKLYEELLMDEEGLESTHNDLIFVGRPVDVDRKIFEKKLHILIEEADANSDRIKEELMLVCDTYRPEDQRPAFSS